METISGKDPESTQGDSSNAGPGIAIKSEEDQEVRKKRTNYKSRHKQSHQSYPKPEKKVPVSQSGRQKTCRARLRENPEKYELVKAKDRERKRLARQRRSENQIINPSLMGLAKEKQCLTNQRYNSRRTALRAKKLPQADNVYAGHETKPGNTIADDYYMACEGEEAGGIENPETAVSGKEFPKVIISRIPSIRSSQRKTMCTTVGNHVNGVLENNGNSPESTHTVVIVSEHDTEMNNSGPQSMSSSEESTSQLQKDVLILQKQVLWAKYEKTMVEKAKLEIEKDLRQHENELLFHQREIVMLQKEKLELELQVLRQHCSEETVVVQQHVVAQEGGCITEIVCSDVEET